MNYLKKVLLGIDQLGNTLIGGAPDETISARAGRRKDAKTLAGRIIWRPLAGALDWIQKDHVERAVCHERDGSQQAEAYKDVFDPDDLGSVCGADERPLQTVTIKVEVPDVDTK